MVLAYGFGSLLVEIGSCLGLWLGLSIVGVFDVLVKVRVLIHLINPIYAKKNVVLIFL